MFNGLQLRMPLGVDGGFGVGGTMCVEFVVDAEDAGG